MGFIAYWNFQINHLSIYHLLALSLPMESAKKFDIIVNQDDSLQWQIQGGSWGSLEPSSPPHPPPLFENPMKIK